MEITTSLLTQHLSTRAFIGKTKQHCYVAQLSFVNGVVEWMIDGNHQLPYSNLSTDRTTSLYFDSFFGFTDYMEAINTICRQWLTVNLVIERINLLADLFKSYFPWHKFVLGCNAKLDMPKLAYADFGSDSFVRYLSQILSVESAMLEVQSGTKSMLYFLNQLNLGDCLREPELDMDKIDAAVKEFYRKYVNEWVTKLKSICQPTDKNDIPTAILIAERCGLPSLAVNRYLNVCETLSTPEQRQQIVRDTRVARYQSK